MNIATYHMLQLHPYSLRTEHLNVGVVVFREEGLRIHLPDNLDKVKAFAPDVPIDRIRAWAPELTDLLRDTRDFETASRVLTIWGASSRLSEQSGRFSYADESQYSERIAAILTRMVEPRVAKAKLR